MIKYKNGAKEIFSEEKQEKLTKNEESVMATFMDGKRDAEKYYKNYTSAVTGTACTTLGCGGLFGLIPAIATSSTTPIMENLGISDQKLMNNSEYYMGYTTMAKKIKSRKVWRAYGISIGINFVVFVALLTLAGAG